MRARYYSVELMRFINEDIVLGDIGNSSSLNRYTYVEGNPATMVDPFGLCAERGWHVLSAITGYAEGASMMYVGLEKIGFGVGMLGAGPVGWVVGAGFIMWGLFDTVCGASDIYEASQHTVMAISGENWKAVNPICDTFFDDDKVLYSMVETTSIAFTGPAMQMASYYLPQLQALSNTIVQGLEREKGATNTGEASNSSKPYTNSRPSFRNGVVEEVWENAKGPDGLVRDPNTGEIINWTPGESRIGVWDMGHIPEAKYSEMHEAYMNGEMTTKEFVDWYNDPANYRPELPDNNRSHRYE